MRNKLFIWILLLVPSISLNFDYKQASFAPARYNFTSSLLHHSGFSYYTAVFSPSLFLLPRLLYPLSLSIALLWFDLLADFCPCHSHIFNSCSTITPTSVFISKHRLQQRDCNCNHAAWPQSLLMFLMLLFDYCWSLAFSL